MIKLYQLHPSGNCYKVRLVLHQPGLPFQVEELEPGVFLAESNAI